MTDESPRPDSTSPGLRLPAPGEDATPFVLRCYVKRAPFRPLFDLEPGRRPLYDEYKLYVWRTATLRDIATLLYVRNRSLSSPTTLHAFRLVHFDDERMHCVSRDIGFGVTRISREALETILDGANKRSAANDEDVDMSDRRSTLYDTMVKETRAALLMDEANEIDALKTLEEAGLRDGDILDCIIK